MKSKRKNTRRVKKQSTKKSRTPRRCDFPAVEKRGKAKPGPKPGSTSISEEQCATFLRTLTQGWSVRKACKAAGVPRSTFESYRDANHHFEVAWRAAEKDGLETLEDEATRRGVHGWDEPVFYQGEVVGHVQKFSDTMLAMQLNARDPAKYRQHTKLDMNINAGKEFAAAMEELTK